MRSVDVNNLQSHLTGIERPIRAAIGRMLDGEDVAACALSVAVVDDAQMLELNRRFACHDEPTDVLSFPLTPQGEEGDEALSGEIVANAERAADVAARSGTDPVGELLLYVVHGCLHLLGYDDHSPSAARRMHARENEILTSCGYPNVFSGAADT